MKYVVKLCSEITIKSRPVRKRFIQRLHTNIKRVLRDRGLSADVILRWDMLEVDIAAVHHEEPEGYQQRLKRVADELACIPGIAHFLLVDEFDLALESIDDCQKVVDLIVEKVTPVYLQKLSGGSFVVRCKRAGRHSFTSQDIERRVGAALLDASSNACVQMRNADTTVALEIKNQRLFVVRDRVPGLGGYPLGTVGPVLSLISGGFDSSVASYDVIRRGMETHFCFFNLGGRAHEAGVAQVSHYLWHRFASSHRAAFVSVPFENVVAEIIEKVSNAYMGVVLKRMMLRAADAIAHEMNIVALVTGESVAQVSSQTLTNLSVIDKVSENLILRPLISMDKTKIIDIATRIGATEYAENIPEYCAVISDKPTTAAKMERLMEEESNFDFSVLDQAVASRKKTAVDRIYEQVQVFQDVTSQSLPKPGQVVIDIRTDQEKESAPLLLHGNKTLDIPAYKINSAFSDLDANTEYLLYCDRGAMSKLHAAHLCAEGHKNVKVYAPSREKI